jgi:trk system potassium uptake protein TrkH
LLATRIVIMECKQLLHPRGVFSAKYHGEPVDAPVLSATIAFISIVGMCSAVLTIALMLTGLDFWTALTAVTACVNVLGPGFGELGNNFQPVSDIGIWILNVAMIMGRLEYLTLLVLFIPDFWRK